MALVALATPTLSVVPLLTVADQFYQMGTVATGSFSNG
jgi:hypothetical protein